MKKLILIIGIVIAAIPAKSQTQYVVDTLGNGRYAIYELVKDVTPNGDTVLVKKHTPEMECSINDLATFIQQFDNEIAIESEQKAKYQAWYNLIVNH
jgi:hypothetical protein